MTRRIILLTAMFSTALVFSMSDVIADSIRLANGDIIRGDVVSLDDQQLTIRSDNFGEMKVPRQKIEIIGFGDKPLEEMFPAQQQAAPPQQPGADAIPSMQHPQVQQQLNRLMQEALGGNMGGIGNMQQDLGKTEQGLRELQRDLGPGSSADALDGYIKLFQMFGSGAAAGNSEAGTAGEAGEAATPQP